MESRKAEVLNMAKNRWLVLVLAMLMLASCGAKDNGGESMDTTADTTGNDNTTAAAETEGFRPGQCRAADLCGKDPQRR